MHCWALLGEAELSPARQPKANQGFYHEGNRNKNYRNDDFADCQAPLCLFLRNAEFVDLTKHPLPPPKCGFAVIEGDLTEENIEKARAAAQRDYDRQ